MLGSLGSALVATATATGLLFGGVSLPAVDRPGELDTLAGIKQAAVVATDSRIDAMEDALDRIQLNQQLSDDHRATITTTFEANIQAMQSLAEEIAADSTVADALTDYRKIFSDYRVFAVAIPQALYAAAGDRMTNMALPRLEIAYDRLLEAASETTNASAHEHLDDMAASIAEAKTSLHGLADAALAVTPAEYNADHTALAGVRSELRDASDALQDALLDGRLAFGELQ